MKKLVIAFVMVLAFVPADLFGWGNATHVYWADQFGRLHGGPNAHEMYGSVLVDAFNLQLDTIGVFMADQTHHNFMLLFDAARGCAMKAVAFGFVSHNDTWGEDFTAHHASRTGSGGYAVVKGLELAPSLIPQIVAILVAAGVDPTTAQYLAEALAPEFGHDLVETGVDLLIKRNQDPAIGHKILAAARTRPGDVSKLLVDAYAEPLSAYANMPLHQAKQYLVNAERQYRQLILQYGGMMSLDEAGAIQALAIMNAEIAKGYLEFYAGVPVTVDPAVVAGFITSAMTLVGPTYEAEVSATYAYMEQELAAREIGSCLEGFARKNAGGEGDGIAHAPAAFALGENYPNPFNPSTTITFDLPDQSLVSLEIFNILGQRVRTIADNRIYGAGVQRELWDGRNDQGRAVPSGTYFTRLTTPGGVFVRKMQLTK